jgi:hypothetical protein
MKSYILIATNYLTNLNAFSPSAGAGFTQYTLFNKPASANIFTRILSQNLVKYNKYFILPSKVALK